MTGWRRGWALGHVCLVQELGEGFKQAEFMWSDSSLRYVTSTALERVDLRRKNTKGRKNN